MKYLYIAILFIVMAGTVNAFDWTIYVRDFNTQVGVPGANISLYEPAKIGPAEHYFVYTNDQGFYTIYDEETEHFMNITKNGYFPKLDSEFINITNHTVSNYFLIPISSSGIVKLRLMDISSFGGHEVCIFYDDNGRLHDCYESNETVMLINNMNYTFIVQEDILDIVNSPMSLYDNLLTVSSKIITIAIMFAILGFLILRSLKK